MEALNYHHLYYFWVTAREGSIARAAERLRLSQPTISAQIRALEESLGVQLFDRTGRGLETTATGRRVEGYASRIFAIGRELQEAVRGPSPEPASLRIGTCASVPRNVVFRVLEPGLAVLGAPRLQVVGLPAERLVATLEEGGVDAVIGRPRPGPEARGGIVSRLACESGIGFFAAPSLREEVEGVPFPGCLGGLPFLVPSRAVLGRGQLDAWLELHDLRPRVVAEFDDVVQMLPFARAGQGVIAVPLVLRQGLEAGWGLRQLGVADDWRAAFHLSTTQAKLRAPALRAIWDALDRPLD